VVFLAISEEGCEMLLEEALSVGWMHDAFAHCKVIGATEAGQPLLKAAGAIGAKGVFSWRYDRRFFLAATKGRVSKKRATRKDDLLNVRLGKARRGFPDRNRVRCAFDAWLRSFFLN
jgi:hypothetical protein